MPTTEDGTPRDIETSAPVDLETEIARCHATIRAEREDKRRLAVALAKIRRIVRDHVGVVRNTTTHGTREVSHEEATHRKLLHNAKRRGFGRRMVTRRMAMPKRSAPFGGRLAKRSAPFGGRLGKPSRIPIDKKSKQRRTAAVDNALRKIGEIIDTCV